MVPSGSEVHLVTFVFLNALLLQWCLVFMKTVNQRGSLLRWLFISHTELTCNSCIQQMKSLILMKILPPLLCIVLSFLIIYYLVLPTGKSSASLENGLFKICSKILVSSNRWTQICCFLPWMLILSKSEKTLAFLWPFLMRMGLILYYLAALCTSAIQKKIVKQYWTFGASLYHGCAQLPSMTMLVY